jgi:hypothetical protein
MGYRNEWMMNEESIIGTWALLIPPLLDFWKFQNLTLLCFEKLWLYKYIERYMQEEHTQKVPLKNTLYFRKYKKDKFLTKRYIILLLLYYYSLSEICLFYIFQNTIYFLTGLFCIHFSCIYLPIYFNAIIFGDIELWDFKIFKILKLKGALVPICTKSLSRWMGHKFQKEHGPYLPDTI